MSVTISRILNGPSLEQLVDAYAHATTTPIPFIVESLDRSRRRAKTMINGRVTKLVVHKDLATCDVWFEVNEGTAEIRDYDARACCGGRGSYSV